MRRAPKGTLRKAIVAMQPLADMLRELERRDAAIGTQLSGIPSRVPRGAEPETALNRLADENAADIARVIGKEGDARQILDALAGLGRLCGADVDTTRLPVRVKVWTDNEDLYDIAAPGRLLGGQRIGEVWALGKVPTLGGDGSLKSRKR